MSKTKLTICFAVISFAFFGAAGIASAVEYFVATNGNDANPGTIDQPWQTLRKAVQILQAGDILYIRGGTYTGANNQGLYNKYEGSSGAATNPIMIRNYPGEIPVLDGGYTSTTDLLRVS